MLEAQSRLLFLGGNVNPNFGAKVWALRAVLVFYV